MTCCLKLSNKLTNRCFHHNIIIPTIKLMQILTVFKLDAKLILILNVLITVEHFCVNVE